MNAIQEQHRKMRNGAFTIILVALVFWGIVGYGVYYFLTHLGAIAHSLGTLGKAVADGYHGR